MALGGGTFVSQNKILPGTYINFVSVSAASSALSERGIATMPLVSDWGALSEVVEVTAEDFRENSVRLFGYPYAAIQLRPLRELYRNARTAYIYRLGTGGMAAANIYGTAKYEGMRGNAITVVVAANVDDSTLKDVSVLLDGAVVASQQVSAAADLADDDFVAYDKAGSLALTAGTPMTGGVNPTVANGDYQTYLDSIEAYKFNAIGCPSDDPAIKALFTAFTKRLRDEQGVKFQCVTYDNPADYEGVINVMNGVTVNKYALTDVAAHTTSISKYALVPWVTGVTAGTEVNKSAQNKAYDGEYTINVKNTLAELEKAIKSGKFAFHRVDSDIRVLDDINSLVTTTPEKGDVFKDNQSIRVIDQIANDIATLFGTKYLGTVPNDEDGRMSLWSDIVKYHRELQDVGAIEGFDGDDVTVAMGDTKKSVTVSDAVTVVNAMSKLYMTVKVS